MCIINMDWIDFREIEFASPEYDECIQLRRKILKVPLGIEFTFSELKDEWKQIHVAAYGIYKLLACLVLEPINEHEIKMKQVAVDVSIQSRGIGTRLVQISEDLCKEKGYKKIVLNARDTAIPFYLRLDYKKVGKQFVEVGIPHYKMEKKL